LWAFGRYALRLTESDFWGLTLAQLNSLTRAYNADQKNKDYRAALICTILANIHRDPKKKVKPFEPEDFFPSLASKKPQKELTEEEMMTRLKLMNAAFGGKNGK